MKKVTLGMILVLPFFLAAAVRAEEKLSIPLKTFSTKNQSVRLIQGTQSQFTLDGEGLVFDLAPGRKAPNLDGLVTRFDIRGDFEITLKYDQLALQGTLPPSNSSLAIWLSLDSDPKIGAAMSRSFRTEGSQFVANKITFEKDGEKWIDRYESVMKPAPVDQTAGKLRLTRQGPTLTHWATTGLDQDFQLVRTWEIGTGDVTAMRIQVNPGGLERGLKVRLLQLDITADALISKSDAQPLKNKAGTSSIPQPGSASSPEKTRLPPWVWILIPGGVLLLGGLGVGWFLRLKGKTDPE